MNSLDHFIVTDSVSSKFQAYLKTAYQLQKVNLIIIVCISSVCLWNSSEHCFKFNCLEVYWSVRL